MEKKREKNQTINIMKDNLQIITLTSGYYEQLYISKFDKGI